MTRVQFCPDVCFLVRASENLPAQKKTKQKSQLWTCRRFPYNLVKSHFYFISEMEH